MRCIFIYNPKSGRGKVLKHLPYIEKKLRSIYDEVVIYCTTSAENLKEIVRNEAPKYDVLVFSGGDGTFNDVACGIAGCDTRPILGYIPTGTTNDIARNLRISRFIRRAVKVISAQKKIFHDVGKINDQYFMYVIAIGACTGTSYTTRQETKKILGRLAYARNGLNEFFQSSVNKIKIINNGTTFEATCPLVLVLNTISVGGVPFNRYGHLNDGVFDVVVINNGVGAGRWNIIWFFLRGILGFRRKKHAVCLKSSNFEIQVDEATVWCVDGERGPNGNVKIVNLHNHLQIYAPPRKARKQKSNGLERKDG